ncbi:MAG: DM13 domain-containing protein [Candidatus Thorarchaeota archaeon]
MPDISRPMIAAIGVAAIVIVAFGVLAFSLAFMPLGNTTPPGETEYTVLLSGSLQEVDSAHTGSGTVQLVESDTGSQAIRFIDVSITNGPDLYVYLSKKSSFSGISDDPGEYVSLGLTPAVTGNFTVSIPDTVNGQDYASVLIWCQAFAVLFTYAIFA